MSEPFEPYTATKKEMKAEAIERMRILGFSEEVIKLFKEHDYIFLSENGLLIKVTEKADCVAENYTKQFGNVIFHIIHSFSNIGETYECLSVSPYKEDWEYEREMLKHGILIAYVENMTIPEHSESGSIEIKKGLTGFIRIA